MIEAGAWHLKSCSRRHRVVTKRADQASRHSAHQDAVKCASANPCSADRYAVVEMSAGQTH